MFVPPPAAPEPRSAVEDGPQEPAAGEPYPDRAQDPPPRTLAEAAASLLAGRAPVSTSVRVLDEALGGGLHAGRLYLVTATGPATGGEAPGAGGGLLAAGAVRAALFRDAGAVLYVSHGASRQDIAARVLAGHLRIGYRAVRQGQLEGDERAAVDELAAGPQAARLLIEDRPRAGAGELTCLARDLKELRLVVVDGLKAQPGPDLPAQELRRLARDLDVPVLVVAEPGGVEGLRAALAPDVEIALALAADDTGYGTRSDRARVTECDLGLSTGAAVRTDLERARLIGPRFDAVGVFGTDEGRRAVDALKSAAHDLLEAPGALPEGLGKRLEQLRKGMPETFSGLEFGDIPDEAQRAVLQEWAARPPLPQTEAGRRLATALVAFYAHAVAHGYDPEAEIPFEP